MIRHQAGITFKRLRTLDKTAGGLHETDQLDFRFQFPCHAAIPHKVGDFDLKRVPRLLVERVPADRAIVREGMTRALSPVA